MGRRVLIGHARFTEERTSFDAIGNCLARTIDGKYESFVYDDLSQLRSDAGRSVLFDSLNRRKESEGVASTHNARHQTLTFGGMKFFYDLDGRRTRDAKRSYSYDALDRLIAVEDWSRRVEFTYDSFNRRMSATTFAKQGDRLSQVDQERYIWQQNCEIGSYVGDRARSLRILGEGTGSEIGSAVAFELNDELVVPIHDLCGNVRVCLNSAGEVLEKLSYTAFGPESVEASLSPWTFASKRQDPYFGLIFFG
jgi:YD repeat-containing protein